MNEFLASIGFVVDVKEESAFFRIISDIDKLATALALAFSTAEAAAVRLLKRATDSLEIAEWSAMRTGSSVASLKALAYALSQTGSSSETSFSVIESLARNLRTNPAIEPLIQHIGVATRINGDLRDTADILLDVVKKLRGENYIVASSLMSQLGVSERDYYQLNQQIDSVEKFYSEHKAKAQQLKADLNNSKSIELNQTYRAIYTQFQLACEAFLLRIGAAFRPIIDRLDSWIRDNQEKIVSFIREFIDGAVEIIKLVHSLISTVSRELDGPIARLTETLIGEGGVADSIAAFIKYFVMLFSLRMIASGKAIPLAFLALGIATAAAISRARSTDGFSSEPVGSEGSSADRTQGSPAGHGAAPSAADRSTGKPSILKRAIGYVNKALGGKDPAESTGSIDRSSQAEELKNPLVKARLMAMTEAEVGSQGSKAQQAFMETILNRAAARKKTIWETLQGNYFPQITHSRAEALQRDPSLNGKYEETLKSVLGGSDITNGATGNASGSVGFGKKGFRTFSSGGENFGVEESTLQWYLEYLKKKKEAMDKVVNPAPVTPPLQSSDLDVKIDRTNKIVYNNDTDPHQTVRSIAASQRSINASMLDSAKKVDAA